MRCKKIFTDIFILTTVLSICAGLSLNLLHLPRPGFYAAINSIIIPFTAFLLLMSIGMTMRFSAIKNYAWQALGIVAIKFFILPVTIGFMGYLLGLHTIMNGLPLQVAIILASMPVGFIAMIPPTLYELDVDLTNSCWLLTNGLLILQLPLLLLIIRYSG